MTRKLRNISWIAFLAAFSFPTGYMVLYVDDKMFNREEFVMNFILGGIACSIVLGILTAIIYIISRKMKSNDAAKPALIVCSVLMLLLLITYAFKMPEAIKEKDRWEFMSGSRETIISVFKKQIEEMPAPLSKQQGYADDVSSCIFWRMELNDELVDKLRAAPDPKAFLLQSPDVKKVVEECVEIYKK